MHNDLLLLFLQLAVILAVSRVLGFLVQRVRQPLVVGEMLAGIALGPSLLGWAWPELHQRLFPQFSLGTLGLLSQLGVVFFLFLVGLELDVRSLRKHGRKAVAISNASILVPFFLGAALTIYLYPRLLMDARVHSFRAAALFMGAAMSVTAFPVLARILTERNLHRTPVGAIAIACAAMDDATAWCLLAFVVAAAQVKGVGQAGMTAALAIGYVTVMWVGVRPFLRKLESLYERQARLGQHVIALIFFLVLASAATTQMIGIHALFGAFMMGCVMPKGTRFVRELSEKLEDFTLVLLLPIFFTFSGLSTRIGLLGSSNLVVDAILIVLVATAGKWGGAAAAAKWSGLSGRDASVIGVLMNTRGLMELVILNIGRELGVIGETVFTMMVLMALVTTAATSPLLGLIYPARLRMREMGVGASSGYSILIPVSLPKSGGPLVAIAHALLGAGRTAGKVFALHLRPPKAQEAYQPTQEPSAEEAIAPLLAQAKGRALDVEPISFVSGDVASDISETAGQRQANLVLMGFHQPVFGKAILGGTVHRVLTQCPCDVGILVDRGLRNITRVLVPYLGGPHDRLALDLAARIAAVGSVEVVVLSVVPPMKRDEAKMAELRLAVQAAFPQSASVQVQHVEDPSPAGVVIHQAQKFDLIIIGVAEEWGLQSHLFGWRPERIARDSPCSLLIVRKREPAARVAVTVPGFSHGPAPV